MSLKFMNKLKSSTVTEDEDEAPTEKKSKFTSSSKAGATTSSKTTTKPKGGLSFLKKGNEAAQAIKEEEAKQQAAKEASGKMFRFRMADNEERNITFLDGDLNEAGLLDVPVYHEHTVKIAGKFENFVCTAETDESQPCPLCEANEKRHLVALLTVIDHTPYTIQQGPNAGKTVQNQKKLFAAKQTTLKTLTKIATKKGGLRYANFDVSRSGDMSPNVGNMFEFQDRFEDWEALAAAIDAEDAEAVEPANYDEEIVYRSPEQLIEMGVGKSFGGGSAIGAKNKSGLKKEL